MTTAVPPGTSAGLLARLLARWNATSGLDPDRVTGPIRGELLGVEGLAERARALARQQRIAPTRPAAEAKRRGPPERAAADTPVLLGRLEETYRLLESIRQTLAEAAEGGIDVGPAGEWLLDNFYVVEEHIREIREGMPRGYYKELPKLATGALAGYPRVYEIAIELIAHTEGHLEFGNIELFVREFQRGVTLTTGELWAIPTMLRLGLIENIRRMALRTVQRLEDLTHADDWAQRIRTAAEEGAQALTTAIAAFVGGHPALNPAFIARFLQQTRPYQANWPPLLWLEQWIAEEAMTAQDAIARSNQRLALTQVMMANSITSLRTIARLEWRAFVEALSAADAVLRRDPSGTYARMTFASRDYYRHIVEELARHSDLADHEVAQRALDLAQRAAANRPNGPRPIDDRTHHIGYYLVDDGRSVLEASIGFQPPWRQQLYRIALARSETVYFGSIAGVTVLLLLIAQVLARPSSIDAWLVVAAAALIPANEVAISIIHQIITLSLPPRILPKIDFEEQGIPAEARTGVVVPILLGNVEAVKEALDHLEVQYLANRDPQLQFALLSDFTDAATETRETDAAIIAAAITGIEALNTRYPGSPFLLFHRPRRWNPRQGVWMGWERKRGKLAEFNEYLRGGARDKFTTVAGDQSRLPGVRYVITLDSDTVLPRGAAAALVGAMAHPLNRAIYDPAAGRVVRGYGILQPRVTVSLPSANRSIFASIQSGHPGVDPYTTAVSDVYQDLFREGSFTGKGIYDVDAFEQATRGRFLENTLLSHDLIEGAYARAALATDVEIFDDYPTRYLTFTRRKHRWIRGDWQLLPWLWWTVRTATGREPNHLSAISRWKIFDNLRRSVVEIAQLVLLVLGWTVLPGSPVLWTLLVLAGIAMPWMFALTLEIVQLPRGKSWYAYYQAVARDAVSYLQQFALTVIFLPHQAAVSADAIVRTLWRLLVTHRKLLEWQTATQVERVLGSGSPREVWLRMWRSIAVALLIGIVVVVHDVRFHSHVFIVAIPLVALWAIAPAIANALSAPVVPGEILLSEGETATALRYALLHWRYFERYATSATHWLIPDNFQETPAPQIALRTSPTNIALQLLATVSAYELGFVTSSGMIEQLERVFRTLEQLQRFRGHLFNWYDLHDLSVLPPSYVSTVDSGNLAGHLLAIKEACLAIRASPPVIPDRMWGALRVALGMAIEELRALASSGAVENPRQWQAVLEAAERVRAVVASLAQASAIPLTLAGVQTLLERLRTAERVLQERAAPTVRECAWLSWARGLLEASAAELHAAEDEHYAAEQRQRLEALAARAEAYALEMDFRFLYDSHRKLLSIGYFTRSETLDATHYDLLASEARLASYIAIAKNDVPIEHWFYLSRGLTTASGEPVLISWSGSMFEYLMPLLVMRTYPLTLLDQTYHAAVRMQIAYGKERRVPWGFSESAYNVRDRNQTYQYRGFGVPALALKRGLSKDLVVAPYATLLALPIEPREALRNLATLESDGALGDYGFRDAVDFTRPAPGERWAIVGAYMAHHIGMGLVSLTNALTGRIWWRYFHADPTVRSAELILCEGIPRRLLLQQAQTAELEEKPHRGLPSVSKPAARALETADTTEPRVALLGSVPYSVTLTNGGGGSSRYAPGTDAPIAVTRWRPDVTLDAMGQWCYIKDVTPLTQSEEGLDALDEVGHVPRLRRLWSAAFQPTGVTPDWYRVTFAADRVTYQRRDEDIECLLDVAVVPDDAAEVRRITITNHGVTPRELELTSYAEVVLGSPDLDRTHPAFSNLFVETEWISAHSAILASRRPRAATERRLWVAHVTAVGNELIGPVTCETDRARFVGRGRTTRRPAALDDAADGVLSGTTGAVLDPIVALRVRVRVLPGKSARVAFTTLVAEDRNRAHELADRYNDPYSAQRALDLSWMHAQVALRELGLSLADAALYQEIASAVVFPSPLLRTPARERQEIRQSQDALWAHGLSGDNPIVLATIDTQEGLGAVRDLLTAHQVWRYRGLTVDLVILNREPAGYLQELDEALKSAIMASSEASLLDKSGGVTLLRVELMPADHVAVLRAAAAVSLLCDGRDLAEMFEVPEQTPSYPPPFEPMRQGLGVVSSATLAVAAARAPAAVDGATPTLSSTTAVPANGLGALRTDGAFEMLLAGETTTPAPWINVIANAHAGCIVSESGGCSTFVENSQSFRLTPWQNDPVSDPCSETIYLRDDESGEIWSPTPQPIRHEAPYAIRHEAGLTVFEHAHAGIRSVLTIGMAGDDPVRLAILSLTNATAAARRITVTTYAEWVLGVTREQTADRLRIEFDGASDAIFATNPSDAAIADRVAFSALSVPVASYTGDRSEFLGRNGSRASPAALHRAFLGEATVAGVDPCAVLQSVIELARGETREVVWLLGAAVGGGEAAARALITTYRSVPVAQAALAAVRASWSARLNAVTVRTPDHEFDAMLNGCLLYQTLACRMWGRTALYQSSGAYGFRDQLQDCMALVYAEPRLAREQIVRSAGRQFVEGDVQHWWHPDTGRGIRTRFCDDLVWLPFVVDYYVATTGDRSVLDERVPFLRMRALNPDEVEVFDRPDVSDEVATIYDHCLRALRRAATAGAHGIPLMGSGDWNDGMNRVGVGGKGESVWMGWFLATTLRRFATECSARGDESTAADFRARADAYIAAVEKECWDGGWYRRAYFDDGTPLGSSVSGECMIDSIAQSWSVISGAVEKERAERAMAAVDEFLVREDARLILLLTPPFDTTTHDPGYIKGYVPGVRENGAQYTHAALWTVLAHALLGHGDRAFALFQMINPLTRTRTPADVERYKVEPYVVAADIYSASGHVGRGGWTWYTGSAGWMYRVGLEAILGFTKRGETLRIDPCIPPPWDEFEVTYRYGSSRYHIRVRNPNHVTRGVRVVAVDGARLPDGVIPLVDDKRDHAVDIEMGGT